VPFWRTDTAGTTPFLTAAAPLTLGSGKRRLEDRKRRSDVKATALPDTTTEQVPKTATDHLPYR
jgi:hypothetical protein